MTSDVSEFESEFARCRYLTILGKSKIRQIYRLIYVKYGLTARCIKITFIIHCCLSFAAQCRLHIE